MEDNGEEHLKFVYHNVFAKDVNETKYAKFGEAGLN